MEALNNLKWATLRPVRAQRVHAHAAEMCEPRMKGPNSASHPVGVE